MNTNDVVEGRYRIIKILGEGGMGTVFLAEHALIKRRVAIKILHPELATDSDVIERFMNEARAAGTLGHPNIVESTDMGFTHDRVPYIVFEYLEGTLLTDEIYRVRGLPVRRAVRIAQQIASALHAAHNARIVHRDLKSDNIFLTDRDQALDHVKVLDFGISRFLTADSEQTRRGLIMGTPEFMAPEQITAPNLVDQRTDIYALGVILYEMLTARRPFSNDDDPRTLLHRIVYNDPPPLDRPEIPRALDELVMKLLAKSPDARYQSVIDVEAVLDTFTTKGDAPRTRRSQPVVVPSTPELERHPAIAGRAATMLDTPWPVVTSDATALKLVALQQPSPARRPWRLYAVAGVGAVVGMIGLGIGLRGGSAAHDAPIAPARSEPPPPLAAVPPPVRPPEPRAEKVSVLLDANAPNARVTFRRRVLAAPATTKVTASDIVELVEVSAPGYQTVRYWLTFDRPTRLVARLTKGTGSTEATEEQTLIALGEVAAPTGPTAAVAPRAIPARSDALLVATAPPRALPAGAPPAVATTPKPASPPPEAAPQAAPRRIGRANADPVEPPPPIADDTAKPIPAGPTLPPAEPPTPDKPDLPEEPKPVKVEPRPVIEAAVVTGVVGQHRPEVLKCVAQGKKKDPKMKGTLTLQLHVEPSGAVKRVQISSTISNPTVAACVVRAAQGWRFPARTTGPVGVVQYPFVIN